MMKMGDPAWSSALYGPGVVYGWFFTLLSVLVTWTANRRSRKKDSVTIDLLVALSLPMIASVPLLYRLHRFPGSIRDLMTGGDDPVLRFSATVWAPLTVCTTFLPVSILLLGISTWYDHKKRAFSMLTVGGLCFSTEIALLVGFRDACTSGENCPWLHILNALGLMIANITLPILSATIFSARNFPSNPSSSVQGDISSRQLVAGRGRDKTALMFDTMSAVAVTGLYNAPALKFLFSIPKTSSLSSIKDLDQAVALVAGMATLTFRIYEVAKSALAEERENSDGSRRFGSSARRID
ncbi:hypothetical protein GP486_005207 [Trichoglossum hirsutum]|uniref:Uncharacterized protein n=1 Tax=Trichoglossum hirsutum TaxID=265104 RepID=A0A9P8L9P3_9PEZI|nr:hypothetical protein GP486_005207 [Trichoglossum hirsutum]